MFCLNLYFSFPVPHFKHALLCWLCWCTHTAQLHAQVPHKNFIDWSSKSKSKSQTPLDRIQYQAAHPELRSYTKTCKLGCCLPWSSQKKPPTLYWILKSLRFLKPTVSLISHWDGNIRTFCCSKLFMTKQRRM